ncbi:hypothetical protein DM860_007047 [Cuscuta australis]|uniref:WW domain-containing protein n=1 Tax=Cuscuta australis TaxID=267555 RepID=A0A328E5S7_9ASTE|nr:hypothetical protein DM860_007047 [Cuscuta australis]
MAGPDMGTITASLERSFQNCSLNCRRRDSGCAAGGPAAALGRPPSISHPPPPPPANTYPAAGDATLELNSQISMPYHWEQCLDLETGEVYYINWRTGKRVKEDPRITGEEEEEEEEDYEEDDDDEDDVSDGESGSSSSSSEESAILKDAHRLGRPENSTAAVLVVAGCQSCLMYFMVPKEVKSCPKCFGQLLHFDRSDPSSCPP